MAVEKLVYNRILEIWICFFEDTTGVRSMKMEPTLADIYIKHNEFTYGYDETNQTETYKFIPHVPYFPKKFN